jgi:hypothetical protein
VAPIFRPDTGWKPAFFAANKALQVSDSMNRETALGDFRDHRIAHCSLCFGCVSVAQVSDKVCCSAQPLCCRHKFHA